LDEGKGYLKVKDSGSLLTKLGLTQQRIAPLLRRLHLLDPLKKVLSYVGIEAEDSVPKPGMNSIDLSQTKAYAGNNRGTVYIVEKNVDKPKEFKEKLKKEILSIEIEGKKVFNNYISPKKVYKKPSEKSPDLIFETTDKNHVVGFLGEGKLYSSNPKKSGMHSHKGIVASNAELNLQDAEIIDVAPTVLDILGYKPREEMKGSSLVNKSLS